MKQQSRRTESSFSYWDQHSVTDRTNFNINRMFTSSLLVLALASCSGGGSADKDSSGSEPNELPAIGAAYSESLGVLQESTGTGPSQPSQDAYHSATLNALLDSTQNSDTLPSTNPEPITIEIEEPVAEPVTESVAEPVAELPAPAPEPISQEPSPQVITPVEIPSTADPVDVSPVAEPVPQEPVTAPIAAPNPAPITAAPVPVTAPVAAPITETVTTPVTRGTYESYATEGFTGTVNDNGTISLEWPAIAGSKGYNVFRASEYYKSVDNAYMIDDELNGADSYYYEIQAYDFNDHFTPAGEGLTVWVNPAARNAIPSIPAHIASTYDLVFSDEFSSTTLDSSKWNTSHLWGDEVIINSEEQYYVDINEDPDFGFNPFELNGETLTIKSIRTPTELLAKAQNQPYLSGIITSYDAFKFTYGYVETRAKLPRGRGLWPAFWLLNAYYVDLKPEIDILEFLGHDVDVVYHTYHYFDSSGELRSTEAEGAKGIDFTAEFHTYAVEWKPGTAIFYIDGIETHRVTDSNMSSQDMYILVNTALGGWWAGPPDSTTPLPGSYEIDYVRAYQKRGPQDDVPFDDYIDSVPLATQNSTRTPNHRPTYEQWPEGFPER